MSGWNSSGVTAQAGGADGSWCFKFTSNAFMKQDLDITKFTPKNPPSLLISLGFRTDPKISQYSLGFSAKVVLYVVYTSGIIDTFTIPCAHFINYTDNTDTSWSLLSQECILQTSLTISQAYIKISTGTISETFYLDFITIQCNEGISQYVSEALTENLPSLLYYTNPAALSLSTSATMVANLGIEATNAANVALNICMYIASAQSATVKIEIKLDQKNIPFSPVCQLLNGDNIIAIPIAVPQVAKGSHYISLVLTLSTGTATIATNMLQIAIDGRYLAGGVSSEPPHAEIAESLNFSPVVYGISETNQVNKQIPISQIFTESLAFFTSQFIISEAPVIVHLTQVADGSYFNSSDQSNFTGSYFVCDGTLHNINTRVIPMTKTTLTTGNMYSATLSDTSTFNSLEKVEVL
jgi:hypothetical protein